MPDTDHPEWPRPGALGFLVGENGDGEAAEITLESEQKYLTVFFVGDDKGKLFYICGTTEVTTDLSGTPRVHLCQFDPEHVKQTLAESLRHSARDESEYGQKCLARAAALERVAAESEAGAGKGEANA